jgi:release factor glutamine methyltransferase
VSVRAALADAASQLQAAGVSSPRVDAELLLAHTLGVPRAELLTREDVDAPTQAVFDALVERRARREPLQYLLGTAPFRYLEVAVGPGVFIPRPETELLVDAVLPKLRGWVSPIVVDLCSGSGAIALSIASEVPGSQVFAVERSPAALTWLRHSAAGTAVTVIEADIAQPGLLAEHEGCVDAVLCNPPYVPDGSPVGAEVAFDPNDAVFAGADGLALMPTVIAVGARLLRSGGVLAIEHDDSQGDSVPALLRADGRWQDVADHKDLTGRPRYVTAVRRH